MHRRLLLLSIITVLCFFLFREGAHSQVVVEKSKDKIAISGEPFYVHTVKKGETAYSISKAYSVTVEELKKNNPAAIYGIKEGQLLRIPVVDNIDDTKTTELIQQKISRDGTKYIYHKLNPGETVYSLSKKYGVSEDEIVSENPKIDIDKIPVGAEITIPKREFMPDQLKFETQDQNFKYHKVIKGETLYSIAERYGLTVRELRRENRGLLFPKVGDFVIIPVAKATEPVVVETFNKDSVSIVPEETAIISDRPVGYTPVKDLHGSFDVALLLPLYIEENIQRTEIDSSQVVRGKPVPKLIRRPDHWLYPRSIPFLEMYEGILIAADTLRKLGLDINLHVYDIKSDTVRTSLLVNSGTLENMDLIIGPVYSNNLSIVAAYAKNNKIPVVSPVLLKTNAALLNNPSLFIANPSLEVVQETIAKRISDYYDNNFILIHTDTSNMNFDIEAFKNHIFRELNSRIPYEEIKFKEFVFYNRSAFDNDSINRLEHALSYQSDNIVIIASEDSPVMSESIQDLHTLSKRYNIKLFGYPGMRGLDNLDPEYYFDLGIELYSPYWIDFKMQDVRKFNSSFRNKFLTEPSEISFAWQGYDIAYYFLSGLAIHGRKFFSDPGIHNPDLLQTSYEFQRKSENDGFENHKLYLIKYTNEMDIKVLDNNIIATRDFSK